MKATATFGAVALAPRLRRIPADHPITQDRAAIEQALATLCRAAQGYAVSQGVLPEDDAEAEVFRKRHGQLAATIRNPVGEAIIDAGLLLVARLVQITPPEEAGALADRLAAMTAGISRYAADTRPRH